MSDASAGIAEMLITRAQLAERVDELGRELAKELERGDRPPVFVGVLKGSLLFFADLVRAYRAHVEVDFIAISSYSGGAAGVVRILKDLEGPVEGRDVVVVEDIVDTGFTLNYLRRTLGQRGARSLRAVTLLDKSVRRIVPVTLEHRGFDVPDVFVVGYGLDFQRRYRNLPYILAVRDIARLANAPDALVGSTFG